MPTREDLIKKLSSHHDPRLLKWEFKAILDTLQEQDEPIQISELLEAIDEKYETENEPLLDYNSLHYNVKALIEQGAIQNFTNSTTKKIEIHPDYITHEVQYLPVSNYCVWLLSFSGGAFILSLIYSGYGVAYTGLAFITGMFYVLAQMRGSEFKLKEQF